MTSSIWNEPQFQGCSPLAQHLYFLIALSPSSLRLPGVVVLERQWAVGHLKCSVQEFDQRFAELVQAGLVKADWHTGVLCFDRELRRAAPSNINVVRMWRRELQGLPDCGVLQHVWVTLRELVATNPRWLAALNGESAGLGHAAAAWGRP